MCMAKFNTLFYKISNSMSNCDSDAPGKRTKNKHRLQKQQTKIENIQTNKNNGISNIVPFFLFYYKYLRGNRLPSSLFPHKYV